MGFIQFCLTAAVVSTMCGAIQALCSPCPFEWMENGNYCYRYFPEDLSYDEADMFCKQFSHTGHNAELATVTSPEELAFIMAYVDAVFNHPLNAYVHNFIWLNNNTKNDAGFETHVDLILYKRLGGRADEKPCHLADVLNNTEYEIVGNQDLVKMVPSPDVVDQACAVYAETGSYLNLGDFKDTCISDLGLCESMTWSLWLKIDTSSGFTGQRYYISSGGQTGQARGIAFLYKSDKGTFITSLRTEQSETEQQFEKSKIPLDQWFHMVIAVDLVTSADDKLMLYVNGVFVHGDTWKDVGTPQDGCTKLYLSMPNTCRKDYDIDIFSGSAAYSDLAVYDGLLTNEQINSIYTCGSPDWELTINSLIIKGDAEYECSASGSPWPTITWTLYHKQTDSWENLDASSDGCTINSVNESTCVVRSTLMIDQSRSFPATGNIVGCTAYNGALITAAYMYLGNGVTVCFRDENSSYFAIWAGRSSIVYTGHRSNRTNGSCATNSRDQCTLDQEKYPFICKIEH